jgi:prepilin-type N-terminal cleavage/methylation domain-containing protein
MRRTPTDPRRAGFTLVELLVVITILGILFALTAAAVVQFIGKGDEVKQRNEIMQLANAVQAFKTHFQVNFLPDNFTVSSRYPVTDPSLQYLKSLWPRIGTPGAGFVAVNWGALNGVASGGLQLKGSQCLVLFLGGPDGVSGFANSQTDPMNVNATNRMPAFFEFAPERLTGAAGQPRGYKDIYGVEYAYFSAGKAGNDYATALSIGPVTIKPYQTSLNPVRFANPNAFQIISAGKDQAFGTGGINWAVGGGSDPNGRDDVANFHPTALGVAQQ